MNPDDNIFDQYQKLQRFIGWSGEDVSNVQEVGKTLRPSFADLIDDFYRAIESEPTTAAMITGGPSQVERLKSTLYNWLEDLFSGTYDRGYVERRWRVGRRHVEIGLKQIFADAAMGRLRARMLEHFERDWAGNVAKIPPLFRSLNRLLDLELAIIEEAYTAERIVEERQEVRKESEKSFSQLVESAHCIIVILCEDHTIAYFNPYAEQVTGYAASEVLNRPYIPLFLPEADQVNVATLIDNVLNEGEPTRGYENPILCRDGGRRMVLWNAQKLDNYEDKPCVLTVGHDITELKRTQERLLQSERLAAIGETVTGLAHESRNAFQRSQACLELLALELEDRPDELELVDRIQRALDHLHHLYEEVRDYAAPIRLDRQMCEITHIWRDAWSHLEAVHAQQNVTLKEELHEENLEGYFDWFHLGQVFRNIFENGISASEEGGEIVVRCERTHLNDMVAARISICDNGCGISEEAKRRVFDPFFTTKTKGTGLGMAIAKRIVEAHGGRIGLGDVGTGAEFVITLPMTRSDDTAVQASGRE